MKTCDLHMHSTYSDGNMSVKELLEMAEEKGIQAISITDHDEIRQYEEIKALQKQETVYTGQIIPGCEITSICNGAPVEVLAYNFDYDAFLPILLKHKENSVKRDPFYCKKTREHFMHIDPNFENIQVSEKELAEVYAKQMYGLKRREPLFDLYIKARKSVAICAAMEKENPLFLERAYTFLRGGVANPSSRFFCDVKGILPTVEQVTAWVHACGGETSLAHPIAYCENIKMILEHAAGCVDGIECYHPSTQEALPALLDFTKKHNLLITGGSDYHGFKNEMGQMHVPYAVFENLMKKHNEKTTKI